MLQFHYLILFSVVFIRVECNNFEEFYNYVNNYIRHTEEYVLPKNKADLLKTSDSRTHGYGEFDFIIVGGGTAGTTLANRLSEISSWSILLLEAGGSDNNITDIPAMNQYTTKSELNWGYYTTPQTTCCQGMENKQCVYPSGKVLGGSGVINAMIYVRGNKENFNDWEKLGNPGWSYEDVLPYFKKTEHVDFPDYEPGFHGLNGTLHVNYTNPPSLISEAFCDGMSELGEKILDYNGKSQLGASRVQRTINFNMRQEGGRMFIDPIRKRRNLHVLLNAFVTKILIDDKAAYGVEFIKEGKLYTATTIKEVLISAAAVNSAQLLMLSGVGPMEDLERLGIAVKTNLPVGKTLLDHPMYVPLYFRTNATAVSLSFREKLIKYFDGEAPLTRALGTEHVAFINLKTPGFGSPDIELLTRPQPTSSPTNPKFFYNFNDELAGALLNRLNPLTDFSTLVVVLKPKSKGSMTLKSNSPLDFPLVDLNFFSDPNNEDIETMYQGIQYVFRLYQTEAFKKLNATYVPTVPACEHHQKLSREYWYCAIRQAASTIYHPTATCTMGPSPETSVVDTNLLVHNMTKLRVVGEAVMPKLLTGHPYAAMFMIAEKTADAIKALYGKLVVTS